MKKLIAVLLVASPCYAGLITHTDYTSGNTITASGQNANENAIVNEFNGNIDNTNIKSGAAIAVNKLAATTANGIVVTDGSGFITAGVNSVTSNSTFTITGLVTFSTITFSSSTSGILGSINGDTAQPGIVGEYFSSSTLQANAITLSVSQYYAIGTLTLTPGDWELNGTIIAIFNAGLDTQFDVGISSVAAGTASTAGLVAGDNWIARGFKANTNAGGGKISTSGTDSFTVSGYRVSISVPTTYYLKIFPTTAGTPTAFGRLNARRMR